MTTIFLGMVFMSFHKEPASASAVSTKPATTSPGLPAPGADKAASQKAFLAVYKVLMSPRCMNCHPSGDAPLQGDDSHPHAQNVQRGAEGKGVYALKCTNCHQPQNTPGENMPPGNPKWSLPPADMKMVFQGRTPRQLAAQLLDPKLNGGRTKQQLIDHVTSDTLVLWGWHPGDGRTTPPLNHAEFARQFKRWIDKGAYLPDK
ncbi:hypothetical protein Q4E93_07715 [Flavitalea sp. BT771]|uniref:hypothetical protein n=1 Tax=Flavitalea sp. BT771 TaxID=3063329 RepID=UPI0026E3DE97|nr:hypothetical protein [Flavitalea sp. BT771]MDO6430468.1 hypothetical protein [Flavitalea sp. BT771]MDV6219392.1 hypothetical protein [Flavitalea sp. BT771]